MGNSGFRLKNKGGRFDLGDSPVFSVCPADSKLEDFYAKYLDKKGIAYRKEVCEDMPSTLHINLF